MNSNNTIDEEQENDCIIESQVLSAFDDDDDISIEESIIESADYDHLNDGTMALYKEFSFLQREFRTPNGSTPIKRSATIDKTINALVRGKELKDVVIEYECPPDDCDPESDNNTILLHHDQIISQFFQICSDMPEDLDDILSYLYDIMLTNNRYDVSIYILAALVDKIDGSPSNADAIMQKFTNDNRLIYRRANHDNV